MPIPESVMTAGPYSLNHIVERQYATQVDLYAAYQNLNQAQFNSITSYNARLLLCGNIEGLSFSALRQIVESENGIEKIRFLTSDNITSFLADGKCPFSLLRDEILIGRDRDNDLLSRISRNLTENCFLKISECVSDFMSDPRVSEDRDNIYRLWHILLTENEADVLNEQGNIKEDIINQITNDLASMIIRSRSETPTGSVERKRESDDDEQEEKSAPGSARVIDSPGHGSGSSSGGRRPEPPARAVSAPPTLRNVTGVFASLDVSREEDVVGIGSVLSTRHHLPRVAEREPFVSPAARTGMQAAEAEEHSLQLTTPQTHLTRPITPHSAPPGGTNQRLVTHLTRRGILLSGRRVGSRGSASQPASPRLP